MKSKELSEDLRTNILEKHRQSQGYKSISGDLNVPVLSVVVSLVVLFVFMCLCSSVCAHVFLHLCFICVLLLYFMSMIYMILSTTCSTHSTAQLNGVSSGPHSLCVNCVM